MEVWTNNILYKEIEGQTHFSLAFEYSEIFFEVGSPRLEANVLDNFKVQLLLHMKVKEYFKDNHGSPFKLRFQWAYSDQNVISYKNVMAIWS